jgi:outer membrane protein TolC
MRSPFAIWIVLAALAAAPAAAQPSLTLSEAIARARARNPAAASSASAEREAAERVTQARAAFLPRIDLTESWQRGNQPVFVFGSLLSQRRFTQGDFALSALNHPSPLDNFRAALTAEQSVFDGGTRASVTAAGLGREIAAARRLVVDQDLAVDVTGAFGRVLTSAAARGSAAAALEAALSDRELAGNRRDAGLITDADVLQLDVYVARTREQQIRAASDERTARAELNQLMGEPLDAVFALGQLVPAPPLDTASLAALETEAIANRPDVRLAVLQQRLGEANVEAARGAFLPQVTAQGGWEFNGGEWNTRASSWVVGAVARLNVFHGLADRARLAEAREQVTRFGLERRRAEDAARLDVYRAAARLEAARAREAAGRAAVAQARESRRIVRDRYESGLTDVTSLLRATEAVVEAEAQQTAAEVSILTETAALERTLGRR